MATSRPVEKYVVDGTAIRCLKLKPITSTKLVDADGYMWDKRSAFDSELEALDFAIQRCDSSIECISNLRSHFVARRSILRAYQFTTRTHR